MTSKQLAALLPFFSFFGSKYRLSVKYPKPTDIIVEPFAGSACYATRYYDRQVILVDKDPVIAGLWQYLIAASPDEIRSLPLIPTGMSVDDFDIPQGAKYLIGFWIGYSNINPRKTQTVNKYEQHRCWNAKYRERVASQVNLIKHWQVICGDYTMAPDIEATWFIDPPYVGAGVKYKCSSKDLDFKALANWCQTRKGQVMVCEGEGADWLPFKHFHKTNGMPVKFTHTVRKTNEVLWVGAL